MKINNYLIDTSIIIDMLRGYEPAIKFLTNLDIRVSYITLFELLAGTRNSDELSKTHKLFDTFQVIYLDKSIQTNALKIYGEHKLSVKLDIPDSLIAATTLSENFTLVTKNTKHFKIIKKLKVISPYD